MATNGKAKESARLALEAYVEVLRACGYDAAIAYVVLCSAATTARLIIQASPEQMVKTLDLVEPVAASQAEFLLLNATVKPGEIRH